MKRLLQSGSSSFESAPISLPQGEVVLAVAAIGEWSAADVWIRTTHTVWKQSVYVLLHGRVGDARVLLEGKLIEAGAFTEDEGGLSAFVLSHRGPRVSAIEVSLLTTEASLPGTGIVYLRVWANDAEHPQVVRTSLVETGSLLAPLESPFYTRQLLGNRATYATTTNGIITSGTAASTVTSLAYLWHHSESTLTYELQKVIVAVAGAQSNSVLLRGAFLTALHNEPGGADTTPQKMYIADANSDATFTYGATGAPTRETDDVITWVADGRGEGPFVWDPSTEGKPIVLRPGLGQGFEIRSVVTATRTASLNMVVTMHWTEF